jgi:electron transfer flavoprotein alpha subunit
MVALVIAEHNNNTLSLSTLSAITAAAQMQSVVNVLVVGHQCDAVVNAVAQYQHVSEVISINHSCYAHQLPENLAELIALMAPNFSHIVASASTFGKNVLPRVAGILQLGQTSDIVTVINDHTFVRPIYAGNAYLTLESLDPIKIVTIRTSAFAPVIEEKQPAPIRSEDIIFENKVARFLKQQFSQSDRPDLSMAKIIISGGRGLGSAENFKLVDSLAKQLNAAVGATRAAVDAGFVSNDYQVGQTGKIVAPDLYIAVGISGAIQHLAGMKDSKIVVAINKDPSAPIFAVADYGLVGDLFSILPELQAELMKLGYVNN